MKRLALALALTLPLAAAPATAQDQQAETGPFDEQADAAAALEEALVSARSRITINGQYGPFQRVLAIFGANWCHDSRDLVTMLERPRIASVLSQNYRVVLVDVGVPQTGNGRNLELAARYGVEDISGTPTVLVLDQDGNLLNSPDNARGWRNASSRSEREVYRFLRQHAKPQD